MSELSQIINGLSKNEFELLKLVLDKFVIAVLLAVAGVVFYFLLERYKSSLVKNLEIAKFHMPRVTKLLEEAENLFKAGMTTVEKLASEYQSYSQWGQEIVKRVNTLSVSEELPMDPSCKSHILNPDDPYPLTVYALLYKSTDNPRIHNVLDSDEFWESPKQYDVLGGFLRKLNMFIAYPSEGSETLIKHAIVEFFTRYSVDLKRDYNEQLDNLRHKVMINIYTDTRKQRKIAQRITNAMDLCSDTIRDFPKNDVIRLTDEDIRAISVLKTCYAAQLTQIKLYVKCVEKA